MHSVDAARLFVRAAALPLVFLCVFYYCHLYTVIYIMLLLVMRLCDCRPLPRKGGIDGNVLCNVDALPFERRPRVGHVARREPFFPAMNDRRQHSRAHRRDRVRRRRAIHPTRNAVKIGVGRVERRARGRHAQHISNIRFRWHSHVDEPVEAARSQQGVVDLVGSVCDTDDEDDAAAGRAGNAVHFVEQLAEDALGDAAAAVVAVVVVEAAAGGDRVELVDYDNAGGGGAGAGKEAADRGFAFAKILVENVGTKGRSEREEKRAKRASKVSKMHQNTPRIHQKYTFKPTKKA